MGRKFHAYLQIAFSKEIDRQITDWLVFGGKFPFEGMYECSEERAKREEGAGFPAPSIAPLAGLPTRVRPTT
jgi:hypothetical protein